MGIPVKRNILTKWDQHWATLDNEDIVGAIQERFDDHIARLKSTNQYQRMVRSYHEYYKEGLNGEDNSYISQGGIQGERTLIHISHYRQMLLTMLTMATAERPNFDAQAMSSDSEALLEAGLANGIIDWYLDDHLLDDFKLLGETSLIFSEAWIDSVWNRDEGPDSRVMDTEDGPKIVKAGDTDTYVYTPMDCAIDSFSRKRDDPDWVILCRWVNKYDLMVRYPEAKEELMATPDSEQSEAEFDFDTGLFLNAPDMVRMRLMFHKAKPSVPGGRYVYYAGGSAGVLLEEGPNPYGNQLPVDRLAPGTILKGAAGWTPGFDILPIAEAISAQYSHILSNHTAFGTQMIAVEKGHGLNYEDMTAGLAFLEYEPGKEPKPVNFTSTPPEMFVFLERLEKVMEVTGNVAASLRGREQSNVKSGSHAAMLHSTGMQMQSGFQGSLRRAMQGVLTKRITNLQKFGTMERTIDIAGGDHAPAARSFKGAENLKKIKRIVVRQKNPLMDTDEGRIDLIKTLSTLPKVAEQMNLSEILTFVTTGRMDPIWQATTKQNLAIRQENEALRDKTKPIPPVTPYEPHDRHIVEHAGDIADVNRKSDPELFGRYHEHIQKHIKQGKIEGHPAINALFGTAAVAPMGLGGENPAMGKGDGAPAEDGKKPGPPPKPPGAQEGKTGRPANLPQMPQDAKTGQRPQAAAGTPARRT